MNVFIFGGRSCAGVAIALTAEVEKAAAIERGAARREATRIVLGSDTIILD